MKKSSPEIIQVTDKQLEALLARAESNTLTADDVRLLAHLFQTYRHIFETARDQSATIAKLRKILFGSSTEKRSRLRRADPPDGQHGPEPSAPENSSDGSSLADPTSPSILPDACASDAPIVPNDSLPEDASSSTDEKQRNRAPGHGRLGANDYPGAKDFDIGHPTLEAGDRCPTCHQGTVYAKTPSILVRFVGQAPVQATRFRLERLRCHLCGATFTAPLPAEAAGEKYDATVASMVGLLKYGSGLPFNRLQRLQGACEVPLAASTQWDIVFRASVFFTPVYEELIRQAAHGKVMHNDDTTARILELMGQRAKKGPPVDDEMGPDRKGIFTTGVVATHDGFRIALFFTGRQHAGENLTDVLKHRAAELEPPIHMSDGLSRNVSKEFKVILTNCLVHARRNFVDIHDLFSKQCQYVVDALATVYHNDARAAEAGLSPEERLSYHQAHSTITMADLHAWLNRQFEEKLVEPNSALGRAITYMTKRWDQLTLFLRAAGAPLDNNICERALKKAILHRKNSFFYKTPNGARVGDMYMSLIYTCETNGANAFEYLTQLQIHADDVATSPDQWMPWNYHQAVTSTAEAA